MPGRVLSAHDAGHRAAFHPRPRYASPSPPSDGGEGWGEVVLVSLASCSPDVRAPDQTREGALTAPSRDWPSRSGLTRRPDLARPLHCAQRFGLRTFATAPLRYRHSSIARQARHRCASTALRPVRLARRPRFADRLMTRQVLPKHPPHNARTVGRLRTEFAPVRGSSHSSADCRRWIA